MNLAVAVERCGDTLVVRLHGELDHHRATAVKQQLEKLLEDLQLRNIILNCAQLTFMDSSGIGVILGRYKQIKPRQGRMVVCHVNEIVHRLFELSGLFKIITLAQNEDEALAHVGVVN